METILLIVIILICVVYFILVISCLVGTSRREQAYRKLEENEVVDVNQDIIINQIHLN